MERDNPFENKTWIKNAISSGSITPPPGDRGGTSLGWVWLPIFLAGCVLMFYYGVTR